MDFQGMSLLKKTAIMSLDVTQEVSVSSNVFSIKVITTMKTGSSKLYADGKYHKAKNMKGDYYSVKCTPIKNGILIVNKPDEQEGVKSVTKRYTEGNRMNIHITITKPNGESVSATRVFDRVK